MLSPNKSHWSCSCVFTLVSLLILLSSYYTDPEDLPSQRSTGHGFCMLSHPHYLSVFVFSEKSSLIVTGANYPDADMTLFPPQPVEPSGGIQPTLTCLISNLSVPFGTVSWKVDGKVVQNAITSEPKRDTSGNTFSMSSYLTVPEVNRASTFTCQIQQAGSASIASRSLKISECA